MRSILELIRINIEAIDDFLSFKMLLSIGKIILVVISGYSAYLFVSYTKTLYAQSMHSLNLVQQVIELQEQRQEDRAVLDKLVNDFYLPSKKNKKANQEN